MCEAKRERNVHHRNVWYFQKEIELADKRKILPMNARRRKLKSLSLSHACLLLLLRVRTSRAYVVLRYERFVERYNVVACVYT